jgi:hypothetical protein
VDHPLYTGRALEELLEAADHATGGELLAGEHSYVFFDEIQYLKDWERHLKSLVDGRPKVRFLASGSAAAALRLKSRESGAGRFTEFLLPPLTFYEYLVLLGLEGLARTWLPGGTPNHDDIGTLNERFVHYLNFGGYPEVLFSPAIQADPQRFIKSDIIDKVLLRDLPSLYGIQDIQELNALFTTLAYHTGTEVSLEELSKNSGVAKNTIKRYIEYLEAAFLIRVVQRLDRAGKRFQRANFFKVYLTNPTMRSALFTPLEADDDAMGRLVETGLFCQFFHAPEELYYGRWPKGEVDMVRLAAGLKVRSVIEVKWSDRFLDQPGQLKSLLAFCRENRLSRALVTTRTRCGTHEADGVTLMFRPASVHALFVGWAVLDTKRFLTEGTDS